MVSSLVGPASIRITLTASHVEHNMDDMIQIIEVIRNPICIGGFVDESASHLDVQHNLNPR